MKSAVVSRKSVGSERSAESTSSQVAWRPKNPASLIDPVVRKTNEREYRYTHGFDPEDGTWVVPLDWIPRSLVLMGQIDWVEYTSRKRFEGPQTFIFHHDHAIPKKPWLASGRNRYGATAYAILGGGYTVTAHGIEDDESDPRDVPGGQKKFRVPRALPKALVGMGRMFAIGYGGSRKLDLRDAGLILAYTRGDRARLFIVPDR